MKNYHDLKQLKSMNMEELKSLCEDIRQEIISSVSKNGGHLASSLGSVELAVALHYVFDSPIDSLIWDVGHQAYPHKLLTGRSLDKLRKFDGVSGFPKPSESEHDPFIAGHAGVSISEATGLAVARPHNFSIAIIGDGSMTSGIAYEAMNHAGHLNLKNLIVVLNDNDMSIGENVGGVASYISNNIINSAYYQKLRGDIKNFVSSIPLQKKFNVDLVSIIKKIRSSAVNFMSPDAFFETFGFRYVGPFDGNDLEVLIKAFTNIPMEEKDSPPLLIHIITKKGKGYSYAEEDPSAFHGICAFDVKTGDKNGTSSTPAFTSIFGKAICELAKKDDKIFAITAAMKEGTGLNKFAEEFPGRFYDVGIAEQHAVTFAAGLAKAGLKPVLAVYSTFMQRSYDQIIHDLALNNLHVVCCMDRAGLVGEDGATHHGIFDISFLRSIPNITLMAPSSAAELSCMLDFSVNDCTGPVFIRYPRGCVPPWELESDNRKITKKESRVIFENKGEGKRIAIFAIGISSYVAKLAAEKVALDNKTANVVVYDARFIKPLDKKPILAEVKNKSTIITIEENNLCGGFGSAVIESIVDDLGTVPCELHRIGIKDVFVEHGTQAELRASTMIDVKAVHDTICRLLGIKA